MTIRDLNLDTLNVHVTSDDEDGDHVSISTVDNAANLTVLVDGERWGPVE